MQIHLKQAGQRVSDFAVLGAQVTVSGVTVDCAEHQQDIGVLLEIRANNSGPGLGGDGAYLAQIEIPARRYHTLESNGEEGGQGEGKEALPLDPAAVIVTLWPTV